MTIVVTGGGSGGHITPILAVAAELKSQLPDSNIVYVGQEGDKLIDIPKSDPNITSSYSIYAGKFRRYSGEGWKQILDFHAQILNCRDLFRTLRGLWQSWRLLGTIKPDIIFTRGASVSVPVALAAVLRGIPYITHDSDSTPGLTNRIIGRWAKLNMVAMEPEVYPYNPDKTVRVGVPISQNYKPLTTKEMILLRKDMGLADYKQIICVTGGGNGAKLLNQIILDNAVYLLKRFPKLAILHIAGRGMEDEVEQEYKEILNEEDYKRVTVKPFVTDLYKYSGAADLVIARGGATNLAEFASQHKACIIIPSKQLIWNVKNAELLGKEQAIVELSEEQAEQELRLAATIEDLFAHKAKMQLLQKKFAQFSNIDSASNIARMIIDTAKGKQG